MRSRYFLMKPVSNAGNAGIMFIEIVFLPVLSGVPGLENASGRNVGNSLKVLIRIPRYSA
jgi:hypothetical protein